MSFETRKLEISEANFKSWIEAGLRQFRELQEDDILEAVQVTMGAWDKTHPIPLTIRVKKEREVVVHTL